MNNLFKIKETLIRNFICTLILIGAGFIAWIVLIGVDNLLTAISV